jgi:hypothetical protein
MENLITLTTDFMMIESTRYDEEWNKRPWMLFVISRISSLLLFQSNKIDI